jgi:hypothetical protein
MIVVVGVGAVEFPVPPVDDEYHNKFDPVAVSEGAFSSRQ